MSEASQKCLACGANVFFENRFDQLEQCQHCSATLYLSTENHEGFQQRHSESRFALGCTGVFHDQAFTVVGSVQYACLNSVWSESLIAFDSGEEAWIKEKNGSLTGYVVEDTPEEIPENEMIKTGEITHMGPMTVFITEKNQCVVAKAQGKIPSSILVGQKYWAIDGNSRGQVYRIMAGERTRTMQKGYDIRFDQIEFND